MAGDTDRGGATSDPAELAGTDQAGQPAASPTEDTDFAEPGGDAPLTTPDTSRVGERGPGDEEDLGSTDAMTSSTGGLAGTSR